MKVTELLKQQIPDTTLSGIYLIYCLKSGKGYIGSTKKSFSLRFSGHKSDIEKGRHPNKHLVSAWKLYGGSSFIFVPIEAFKGTREQLIERENYYIDLCWKEDLNCLYNMTRAYLRPPSNGMLGKKHSPETLQKMSEVKLGKTKGEDFKKKMSEIVKGRKWSEESKQAFRKPKSEEAKRKMSEAKKGKKLSEETKKRKRETLKVYLEN